MTQPTEKFPGEHALNILHAFVQEQMAAMPPFQREATGQLLTPAFQRLATILTPVPADVPTDAGDESAPSPASAGALSAPVAKLRGKGGRR
jgi:hypothetical protein